MNGAPSASAGQAAPDRLRADAAAVLDENWLGHATRPSPRLYPHQWSWDTAFTAIGNVHIDQQRAETELRSLFSAQWSNGALPHIVFTTGDEHYFPGPGFWQPWRSPYARRHTPGTGLVQPPVHATAVRYLLEHAPQTDDARRLAEDLLPNLAAWHDYLHRERTRDARPLVEIWHPWESGMDNSPLWDPPLAALRPDPDAAHTYTRIDLTQANPDERPTDDDYHRYLYLVAELRDTAYDPGHDRHGVHFAVHDVLFNSILVQANRDLAHIARDLGARHDRFDDNAEALAAAIDTELWDDELGCYVNRDIEGRTLIRERVSTGLTPLYAGIPTGTRLGRILDTLHELAVEVPGGGWALPSLASDDPRFEPIRYWRGPIWINVNWLLHRGLTRYGFREDAQRLRQGMLGLIAHSGFWEHYDPVTGAGHGAERFAWTAALTLALLEQPDHAGGDGEQPAHSPARPHG